MITPPNLKPGDTIGIVAPARKIEKSDIEAAVKIFEQWGLYIVFGKNLFNQERQFAGTDIERANDLQFMLDDPNIKAIICARGGYGTIKVLPHLDFSRFIKNPKWIVGYSDITALHAHLNQNLGVKTIHGIMPLNFPRDSIQNRAIKTLKKALWGNPGDYVVSSHPFNRKGEVTGKLVGGNLSVLYSISGSKYDINMKGKILFIEDLDEYLYHIDRMMMNLKYSGKLENLKGLVVGGMTGMNDNTVAYGRTAYEIIQEAVDEYHYPVCYHFPAGHIPDNLALVLGATVELNITGEGARVKFRD
ncbi:MAG: LD-carboxypeptidase [Bacteroidales bacterium]